jgi:hypothetical protein
MNCQNHKPITIGFNLTTFSSQIFSNCISLNSILIVGHPILLNVILDLSTIKSIEQQAFVHSTFKRNRFTLLG